MDEIKTKVVQRDDNLPVMVLFREGSNPDELSLMSPTVRCYGHGSSYYQDEWHCRSFVLISEFESDEVRKHLRSMREGVHFNLKDIPVV